MEWKVFDEENEKMGGKDWFKVDRTSSLNFLVLGRFDFYSSKIIAEEFH